MVWGLSYKAVIIAPTAIMGARITIRIIAIT